MQTGDIQKAAGLPMLPSADGGRLDDLKRAAEKGDAGETAKKFETLFAVMLVRELRRSMPESPFGEGAGADVYEGWFDEHLGNALASRDALGLAGMVKTAIGRTQAAIDGTKKGDAAKVGGAEHDAAFGDRKNMGLAAAEPAAKPMSEVRR